MNPLTDISSIAHIIQLAVAPVFLLTGIAGFLNVLTNRLSRITDRSRVLEEEPPPIGNERQQELKTLQERMGMINKAIRVSTLSALMVCLVVVALFLGDISAFNLSLVISVLFIGAMMGLIIGLLYFLAEVTQATHSMQSGMKLAEQDP